MTCATARTALLHARQHATICNGLECAPPEPVSAPYLQAAYERMKLGVRVDYRDEPGPAPWRVQWLGRDFVRRNYVASREGAVRLYFDACATLTDLPPAAASSDAVPPCDQEPGTAGGATATLAEPSAFSSGSAAPNPSSVQSVAPGAETPSVLGALDSGDV